VPPDTSFTRGIARRGWKLGRAGEVAAKVADSAAAAAANLLVAAKVADAPVAAAAGLLGMPSSKAMPGRLLGKQLSASSTLWRKRWA